MKNKRNKNLNEKGITLVALVVTVVVLLILAGITINLILGPNSIFNNAKEAKDQTGTKTFEERLEIVYTEAMLKRGENGGLTPEEYFEILKNHGIISDLSVPGGNISTPTENEDGSKTYEIKSDDDYIFEATIYPDGRVETEVIGKDGNIESKIRSILVTNKTQTSIDIRVSARLQGGTVKAYYKKLEDVAENEPEDSTDGYIEIILNENIEGTATPLTAGEEYKIKVILKNGEEVVAEKSINEKTIPRVVVESVELNETSINIKIGKEATLIATIKPDNAEEKGIIWSSSNSNIATVDQNGKVTGVAVGTATITATAKDGSEKFASCKVIVENMQLDLYNYGDKCINVTSGWGYIGGRYYPNPSYAETESYYMFFNYGGYIATQLKNVNFKDYNYINFELESLVGGSYGKLNWTAFTINFYDRLGYYDNTSGWANSQQSLTLWENNWSGLVPRKMYSLNIKDKVNKANYMSICTGESRNWKIYRITLSTNKLGEER